MSMRTYMIELRVDFEDKEKEEIMLTACKAAAKHVFTTAVLIADKRKPQIALQSGDHFAPAEDIMLADDLE
jgi:hypothetical protein